MSRWLLLALAAWVAFSGMLYELVLAQSMAAAWGATLGRYQFTIGVYLAALGVGAAAASTERVRAAPLSWLLATELGLAALGAATPWVCLGLSRVATEEPWLQLGYGAWIAAIGMLVGAELPILLDLAREAEAGRAWSRILAADYLGMLIAGASFPVLLLPELGLVGASFLGALLSALAAVATGIVMWRQGRRAGWALGPAAAMAAALAFGLSHSLEVQKALGERWMGSSG